MKIIPSVPATWILVALSFSVLAVTGCSSLDSGNAVNTGHQASKVAAPKPPPLPPAAQAVKDNKTMPDQAKALEMNRIMSQQNNK
ncbi:MAG: hypothetical protein H7145_18490 [Akkermansiaceae bacterium]|nr:hypothetical protein [Armatimonadota bacterium]